MEGAKRLLMLLGVIAMSGATAACDDDDEPMGPPVSMTALRVVHGAPDAPAVDIYAEGSTTPLFTNLAYGEASEYLEVDAGTYNILVRAAGSGASSEPVFETGDLQLVDGDVITALAAGLLASEDPADEFRVLPLLEAFETPASGNARVRVVHASPDAPAVDIDVGDDGTSEITDLDRFEDTGASGVDLPAGTALSIGIVAGGERVTGFTVPGLTSGSRYFLIASGLVAREDITADDAFKLLAVDQSGSAAFIEQDAGMAMIRAVHASPDAPAVDVYVEGIPIAAITALEYGVATEYLEVPEGSYNIQLRAHPSTATDPVAYETGAFDVTANQKITAVAAGFLESEDAADRFRVLPLVENFGIPGSTRVRIVHAGPDAPTVDLDVGDDGSAEITGLERFADTGEAGISLPSGEALQIGVVATGGNRLTAFTTPDLPDGGELFVIATGTTAVPARAVNGFSLLVVPGSGSASFIGQNPVLYALHGGPDAPAVDIYAGDNLLASNLSFGDLSSPIQVPPADFYVLDFFPAGAGNTGEPAAQAFTPDLEAGQQYLAVAAGELTPEDAEQAFTLVAFDEMFDLDTPDAARVRAIHASGDAPPVDVGTVDPGTGDIDQPPVFSNLAFGSASEAVGAEVPAATLTLGVAPTGDPTPVATFDVTTSAGLRTFAVAAGALAADPGEEAFRLFLVVASENPWIAAEVLPN